MTARRKRLKLNGAELYRLGRFLAFSGMALGEYGRDCEVDAGFAQQEWQIMDPVARAAVIRLGLKPQLTALGCIPE